MRPPTNQSLKKFTQDYLIAHRVGTLATVDANNYPDIAPVYCVVDKDLNLYFTSRIEGRKFINITIKPHVALSFANENGLETVLVKGRAERISQFDLEQQIIQNLMIDDQSKTMRSLPSMQMYESGHTNEVAVIKIAPTEITYANFSSGKGNKNKIFFQKVL